MSRQSQFEISACVTPETARFSWQPVKQTRSYLHAWCEMGSPLNQVHESQPRAPQTTPHGQSTPSVLERNTINVLFFRRWHKPASREQVLGRFLIRVAVILCVGVLVVEGYYVYRFYADPPVTSDAAPATSDDTESVATESEATAPQTQPATQPSVQEVQEEREREAEYVARIGEIQAGSVEAFRSNSEKLLRPDSLTDADVEEMEDGLAALEDYAGQAEDLEPTEEYVEQRELFAAAVEDLSAAAGTAYRLVTDPTTATQSDYDTTYDVRVARAAVGLQRSNEILGEDFETIEPPPRDGR